MLPLMMMWLALCGATTGSVIRKAVWVGTMGFGAPKGAGEVVYASARGMALLDAVKLDSVTISEMALCGLPISGLCTITIRQRVRLPVISLMSPGI